VGEIKQVRETPVQRAVVKPQVFAMAGMSLPVKTARYIFPVAALVAGGLVVYFRRRHKTLLASEIINESEMINKRYGNRIIHAGDKSVINSNGTVMRVKTFKDLLKVADEREQLIICLAEIEFNNCVKKRYTYYVADGETLYMYKPRSFKTVRSSDRKASSGNELACEQ